MLHKVIENALLNTPDYKAIETATQEAVMIVTAASVQSKNYLEQAKSMEIVNHGDYEKAVQFLRIGKKSYNELEKQRKEKVKPINDAKTGIQAMFKPDLDIFQEAEKIIKKEMVRYDTSQELIRKLEQEKLRLKAEAEEKKKREALAARAKKWEEKGNTEKAKSLQEAAETTLVPVPIIQKQEAPKGISFRIEYKVRVTNIKLIPAHFFDLSQSRLDKYAQNTKGQMTIPGGEIYEKKIPAFRS